MSKIPLDSASKMVEICIYTINWGGNYYEWECAVKSCYEREHNGYTPFRGSDVPARLM